jgi:uncharacterized protein YifE (UPF0438 family)
LFSPVSGCFEQYFVYLGKVRRAEETEMWKGWEKYRRQERRR